MRRTKRDRILNLACYVCRGRVDEVFGKEEKYKFHSFGIVWGSEEIKKSKLNPALAFSLAFVSCWSTLFLL